MAAAKPRVFRVGQCSGVIGKPSTMGADADGKTTGECLELKFEELRRDPGAT
ncbi:MAG: hypothetical protein JNJ88_06790 [Planctomycetes bacterium]|nr:hypothetical protein [Planctomycetota bacterium]